MKVLVNAKDLPYADWLEYRKLGVGGSDVGVIVGLNKYKSAFTLFLEKTNQLPTDDEQSEAAYWGNTLEDIVAQEFSKRTGLEVNERHELLQHDTYDFMLANLDREVTCPNRGTGILECKTSSEYLKDEWSEDKIPDSYYLQVQHYLAVTGYPFAYIAVLIGGNKFVHKEIERDEEVINYLIQLESDFWNNHILKNVPPAIDGSESTSSSIKLFYSESNDGSVELSSEEVKILQKINETKKDIQQLELKKSEYENRIKNYLGESEIGEYEGSILVTWKANKRNVRQFKIKNTQEVLLHG
ncbi:YqaJ viral recombinase family protein [Priestia aryabhattai]|uniref:YqaJ viral recombinase family nuclease n=1 Tax=Priestia aryabhattai TaxID=412384 RepID=UPI0035AC13DD